MFRLGTIRTLGLAMLLPALATAEGAKKPPPIKRPATPPAIPASKGWHTATPGKAAPTDARGHAKLVLQGLNIPDRVELSAANDKGGFSAEDLDRAAHVMREPSTGNEHPIDPHLLDFVYRVQTHFNAHEVRIISGYRTPTHGGTSNHGRGRALDLVVPGTVDEEIAKFAREQGFCGVGTYPVSGFVHLDVRPRSYFWVDSSGPGKKSRVRGILPDVANRSDGEAQKRGDLVIPPFIVGPDVDAVCPSPTTNPDSDDDTDS